MTDAHEAKAREIVRKVAPLTCISDPPTTRNSDN